MAATLVSLAADEFTGMPAHACLLQCRIAEVTSRHNSMTAPMSSSSRCTPPFSAGDTMRCSDENRSTCVVLVTYSDQQACEQTATGKPLRVTACSCNLPPAQLWPLQQIRPGRGPAAS